MRLLPLALLFFSPLSNALLVSDAEIKFVEYAPDGRVSLRLDFNIDYRNFDNRVVEGNTLRSVCAPDIYVNASVYSRGVFSPILSSTKVTVSPTGSTNIPMREAFASVSPSTQRHQVRIQGLVGGEKINVVAGLSHSGAGSACSGAYREELTSVGGGPIIVPPPPPRPHCDINLQSNISHGNITLTSVGDSHTSDGAVQVTCSSTTDVTVSTGLTSSLRVNDTLSTDISIDGRPNSATKTVNGSTTFPVSSRLYRTTASSWGGSFNQPVVLTISWP